MTAQAHTRQTSLVEASRRYLQQRARWAQRLTRESVALGSRQAVHFARTLPRHGARLGGLIARGGHTLAQRSGPLRTALREAPTRFSQWRTSEHVQTGIAVIKTRALRSRTWVQGHALELTVLGSAAWLSFGMGSTAGLGFATGLHFATSLVLAAAALGLLILQRLQASQLQGARQQLAQLSAEVETRVLIRERRVVCTREQSSDLVDVEDLDDQTLAASHARHLTLAQRVADELALRKTFAFSGAHDEPPMVGLSSH